MPTKFVLPLAHPEATLAAWGLREAVVGGFVTPDIVVVDKRTDLRSGSR